MSEWTDGPRTRFVIRYWPISNFFALAPVGLVVAYDYVRTNSTLSQTYAESRMSVLMGAADGVRARVADCQKIAELAYANSGIMELLSPSVDGRKPDYALVKQVMDTFGQRIFDMGSEKYLLALMIEGQNGLDLRYGHATAFVNFDSVFASAWYQSSLQSDPPLVWPGLAQGIFTKENESVIPMVRPMGAHTSNLGS